MHISFHYSSLSAVLTQPASDASAQAANLRSTKPRPCVTRTSYHRDVASRQPSPNRLQLIGVQVGKEIIHDGGLLRAARQQHLRRPRGVAATMFPIGQSAFAHPNTLRELELGQSGGRAECGHVHGRDSNTRLSAATIGRANAGNADRRHSGGSTLWWEPAGRWHWPFRRPRGLSSTSAICWGLSSLRWASPSGAIPTSTR